MTYKEADVILIYPRTGMDFGATVAPPHSLLAVAAPLHKKGYKVKIIDQRVDTEWEDNLIEYLKARPICAGISAMTGTQIRFALNAADIIRRTTDGKIPIIWGGPHPSILPVQTLENENVDIVCIGEGDMTLVELVGALASKSPLDKIFGIAYKDGGRIITTPARPLVDIEGLLPVPWDLVDVEKYIHKDFYIKNTRRSLDIGQTSRGCPFKCGFCSSASLRKRQWRAMSVEKSLDAILGAVKRFRLESLWIRDDEFYIDRRRSYSICEGILKSGKRIRWYTSGTRIDVFNRSTDEEIAMLKRSGADTLKFGAESGSDRILELMQKGIRREDTIKANLRAKKFAIIPAFALMIGFPTETFDEIDQTIGLFVRLKKDNPMAQFEVISPYTALPGTPLYDFALKYGLQPPQSLEGWIDWLYDEYDLEGRKIPWFNLRDRKRIGNITYMSILANTMPNAISGVKSDIARILLKLFFTPIGIFERFKLKRRLYSFCPELDAARFLRKKIFYKSERVIH